MTSGPYGLIFFGIPLPPRKQGEETEVQRKCASLWGGHMWQIVKVRFTSYEDHCANSCAKKHQTCYDHMYFKLIFDTTRMFTF